MTSFSFATSRAATILAVLVVVPAATLAACSSGGGRSVASPSASASASLPPGNLLANPGFADGAAPWFSPDTHVPFEVTRQPARSDPASAHLPLRGEPSDEGTRIVSVAQDIAITSVPPVLRGAVYVDTWSRGAQLQYVQVVFIPVDAPAEIAGLSGAPQLRYVLAGIDAAPFRIQNARYIFKDLDGPDLEPELKTWIPFELRLRDDYAGAWGIVPDGGTRYRVLLEARFDGKAAGEGAPSADVYFDDLYAGTHSE